eukprot:Nk52_evm22s2118 gene=Nk52_evmTU22s2118
MSARSGGGGGGSGPSPQATLDAALKKNPENNTKNPSSHQQQRNSSLTKSTSLQHEQHQQRQLSRQHSGGGRGRTLAKAPSFSSSIDSSKLGVNPAVAVPKTTTTTTTALSRRSSLDRGKPLREIGLALNESPSSSSSVTTAGIPCATVKNSTTNSISTTTGTLAGDDRNGSGKTSGGTLAVTSTATTTNSISLASSGGGGESSLYRVKEDGEAAADSEGNGKVLVLDEVKVPVQLKHPLRTRKEVTQSISSSKEGLEDDKLRAPMRSSGKGPITGANEFSWTFTGLCASLELLCLRGAVYSKGSEDESKSLLLRSTDSVECYRFSIEEQMQIDTMRKEIYGLLRAGPSPLNSLQDYLRSMSLHKMFPHIMNLEVDEDAHPVDPSRLTRSQSSEPHPIGGRMPGGGRARGRTISEVQQPEAFIVHASANVKHNKTTGNALMKSLGTNADLTFLPSGVEGNKKGKGGDGGSESDDSDKLIPDDEHKYKKAPLKGKQARSPRTVSDYFKQMAALHNIYAMSKQLQRDANEARHHKYFAYQMALYYQMMGQVGSPTAQFKSSIEEHFDEIKASTSISVKYKTDKPPVPRLDPAQVAWVNNITTRVMNGVQEYPTELVALYNKIKRFLDVYKR